MDADRQVGGADGARPEAGGGPTGQLAVGLGHERGAALVAGRHDADARLAEASRRPRKDSPGTVKA